ALLLPAVAFADLSGTFTMPAGSYVNFDNGNGVAFTTIGGIGFDGTNLTFLGTKGVVFSPPLTGQEAYYKITQDTLEPLASQESPNSIPASMMAVDSILGIRTNRGNVTKLLVTAISADSLTFKYQTYIVAKPTITGVTNSYSYIPNGFPNSGVAPS